MKKVFFIQKAYKASFTIEAVVIMPLTIAVIFLLIFFSMFAYNRAVLTQDAYIAAFRGCNPFYDIEKDAYEKAYQSAKELTAHKLLAMHEIQPEIKADKEKVEVIYTGFVRIPRGIIPSPSLQKEGWNLKVKGQAKRQEPVDFIRKCRKIEELLGEKRGDS